MLTVAVDFDGVLARYDGWKGEDVVGDPLPGALKGVQALLAAGLTPVVYTTRKREVVEAWLAQHEFPSLYVWYPGWCGQATKPLAIAYVDDRAVRFTGSWPDVVEQVRAAKPWWEGRPELPEGVRCEEPEVRLRPERAQGDRALLADDGAVQHGPGREAEVHEGLAAPAAIGSVQEVLRVVLPLRPAPGNAMKRVTIPVEIIFEEAPELFRRLFPQNPTCDLLEPLVGEGIAFMLIRRVTTAEGKCTAIEVEYEPKGGAAGGSPEARG